MRMHRLLQHWVTEHAQRRSDATAVVCDGNRLTYAELDAQSTKLARLLRESGCRPGDRVALLARKSTAALVAIFGIYKAEAIYVPLDPASPSARLQKILGSCECRWMLAGGNVSAVLAEILKQPRWRDGLSIGWLDTERPQDIPVTFTLSDLSAYSAEPRDYQSRPTDPAHILFTSGSTGDPKGVVISHANGVHCAEWARKYFSVNATDRLSCHPPLPFDMSFMDILTAAAAGAELHLVSPEVSVMPNGVAEFIRESSVTQWFSVPSVLRYMAQFDRVRQDDFPALKRVLWAGDVLPTPTLMYWMKRLPHVSFTNLYGPTETTIVSSVYTVPECPDDPRVSIPIGVACEGEELLVLDAAMRPTRVGDTGEIHIGGAGVASGYWGQPALTDAVFVPDPRNAGKRLYKTGDLGKVGEDGLVYILGRSDSQIKCRGYRIELAEIEAALHTITGLTESAVVALPSERFEGSIICCAYCAVPDLGLNPVALRRELSRMIPSYMLPSQWLALSSLPMNANGKVDRRMLKQAFTEQLEAPAAPAARETVTTMPASRTRISLDQILLGVMTYAFHI
jgi:amino acid adenylation domain-containing protein